MTQARRGPDPQDTEAFVGATTEAGVVATLARDSVALQTLSQDRALSLLVPEGYQHERIDLERYDDKPRRKRGDVTLHDAASFALYFRQHETSGTAVYADVRKLTVEAVINGHGHSAGDRADGPGWGDHRAKLALRHSHEWRTWTANEGLSGQKEFAEFIEDNYADIHEPDHATMLEIASSIEASSTGQFEGRHRLQDGSVALRYTEQVDARAGQKGDLTIPETFTVGLRVFEGSEPVKMTARLRYRIREGKLAIGYKLERLDDVKERAFENVINKVELESGHTCLRGESPAPVGLPF